ncbi:MAG: translation initiation factor IF-2 [Candidatus Pacebacteria bacterium]|nr:translation initiation factor IF-2 [Candidatus Paceibacterota bacterium]MDD5555378.1 translation initiation factor IF-2 [Candidatus Paceibacterota bacterium]
MEENEKKLTVRPPVVVILGHIDHGKTSLLTAIKDFRVLEKESGGITQHVGAYEIEYNGRKLTFLDTPGHESFSAIRSRGSQVADIAVLVIDAAEGVKKQTKEAINHIKEAGIALIVALNKMDKPEANPEMVKGQLNNEGIVVESSGGDVPSIEISAKTGKGVADLLGLIQLVAEMKELKTDLSLNPEGVIIESYMDNQKGPTSTAILSQGILKKGDVVGTSSALGKVRSLKDFQGKELEQAYPSQPIVLVGFDRVPAVGEKFLSFKTMEEAKANIRGVSKNAAPEPSEGEDEDKPVLNIVLKTDAVGSLEAIEEFFKTVPQEEVSLKVIKSEAGNVNENDVKLAKSTKSVIFAFRVKKDNIAEGLIERDKIKYFDFDLIYGLAQKTKELMERKVKKEKVRVDVGKMEVSVIFRTEKNRQIVGGLVTEGLVERTATLEITRGGERIGEGKIIEIQANKKNFESIKSGKECAILYQGQERIKEGDELVFFKYVED